MKTNYMLYLFLIIVILLIIYLYFVDIPSPSKKFLEDYELEVKWLYI